MCLCLKPPPQHRLSNNQQPRLHCFSSFLPSSRSAHIIDKLAQLSSGRHLVTLFLSTRRHSPWLDVDFGGSNVRAAERLGSRRPLFQSLLASFRHCRHPQRLGESTSGVALTYIGSIRSVWKSASTNIEPLLEDNCQRGETASIDAVYRGRVRRSLVAV